MNMSDDFEITKEIFADVIRDRRDFLHEISNKLTIAEGMASIVMSGMADGTMDVAQMIVKLEKSINAIRKVVVAVKEERQKLVKLS